MKIRVALTFFAWLCFLLAGCVPSTQASSPMPVTNELPPAATNAVPTTVTNYGFVTFDAMSIDEQGNFWLIAGNTTTVNWEGAPPEAERYEFMLYPVDGSLPVLIGTDMDASDAVSVQWIIPAHMDAALKGKAHFPGGGQAEADASGLLRSGEILYGGIRYPFLTGDAGNFALEAGATITLTWEGAPVNADLYQFILQPLDGSPQIVIGVDEDASDGVSISWAVPAGIAADLKGVALYSDGKTAGSNPSGTVYSAK